MHFQPDSVLTNLSWSRKFRKVKFETPLEKTDPETSPCQYPVVVPQHDYPFGTKHCIRTHASPGAQECRKYNFIQIRFSESDHFGAHQSTSDHSRFYWKSNTGVIGWKIFCHKNESMNHLGRVKNKFCTQDCYFCFICSNRTLNAYKSQESSDNNNFLFMNPK